MWKYVLMILLCLDTTPVIAQGSLLQQSFDACRLLAQHHPIKARQSIAQWESLQGSRPYTLACEGITWFHQQAFSRAASLLEQAAVHFFLEHRQEKAWSYTSACWAYLRAHQPSDAVRTCTQAIRLYPSKVELRIDRSFAYVEQKLYESALADLNFVLQNAPNHATAYMYRSALHIRLGRLTQALSDVRKALALHPQSPQILLLRANIWQELGDQEKAILDWRRILSIAPQSLSAQKAQYYLQKISQNDE